MQLSRFFQILVLRDVFMYLMPGVIFEMLLCGVGLSPQFSAMAVYCQLNFGDFFSSVMWVSGSYGIGYMLHNFTAEAAKRWERYLRPAPPADGRGSKVDFDKVADDLERHVATALGRDLSSGWADGIRTELSADARGVRYVRYLCEMMVMERYPEIHHLTIERRSSLKNFQLSLSGALVCAGLVGCVSGTLAPAGWETALSFPVGVLLLVLGIAAFLPIEKNERDLRISIWRAFHAMSLIESRVGGTRGRARPEA